MFFSIWGELTIFFIESHWHSWTIILIYFPYKAPVRVWMLCQSRIFRHLIVSCHCHYVFSAPGKPGNVQGFCKMSNFRFDGDPNAHTRASRTRTHHLRTHHGVLGLHQCEEKKTSPVQCLVPPKLGTPTPKKTQNKLDMARNWNQENPSNNQSICAFLFEAIWNQPTQPQKKHPPQQKLSCG